METVEITGKGSNTRVHYQFRDAHNYKSGTTYLVVGAITPEQLERVRANLIDGCKFAPEDIEWETTRFGGEYEDDPYYHELVQFELTDAHVEPGWTIEEMVEELATTHWSRDPRLPIDPDKYATVLVVVGKEGAAGFLEVARRHEAVLFASSGDGVTPAAVSARADPSSWSE